MEKHLTLNIYAHTVLLMLKNHDAFVSFVVCFISIVACDGVCYIRAICMNKT